MPATTRFHSPEKTGYPFTDISRDIQEPFFPQSIDLAAQADALAMDDTIQTEFDLYSKIVMLTRSLNDGHFAYRPDCVFQYSFLQPFVFHSEFADGKTIIKILDSSFPSGDEKEQVWGSVDKYRGMKVVSINGVDAVNYVQSYANIQTGFSRTPESRFNNALGARTLTGRGSFDYVPGKMTNIRFLPLGTDPFQYYTLQDASEANVTVQMPWLGIWKKQGSFSSRADYYKNFCQGSGGSPVSSASLNRLDSVSRIWESLDWNIVKQKMDGIRPNVGQPNRPSLIQGSHAAKEAKSSISNVALMPGTTKFDLTKPLLGDNNYRFYILEDAITGIFVLPNILPVHADGSPLYERDLLMAWMAGILGGFKTFEDAGVTRVMIYVTGNNGGDICTGNFLVKYLFPDAPVVPMNLRLNKHVKALYNAGLYRRFLVPINSTDVLSSTTRTIRGGIESEFSGFFSACDGTVPFGVDVPKLKKGWKSENVIVVSSGHCGSACAVMVRALRDGANVRSVVYGGFSGNPFTPTSFEGGVVAELIQLTAGFYQSSDPDVPKGFKRSISGHILVTEGYSLLGKGNSEVPVEFVREDADFWISIGPGDSIERLWAAAAAAAFDNIGGNGTSVSSTKTLAAIQVSETVTTVVANGESGHKANWAVKFMPMRLLSLLLGVVAVIYDSLEQIATLLFSSTYKEKEMVLVKE
ncbi:hypothetical protein HDU97_006306 [Phlyctochytrium planicorne]|nr:hypothetical protein HDU97_006306 [Phlyctochytrium planicorne]